MKLWKISQEENNDFDTYSDAVVAAETEAEAQLTHPGGYPENHFFENGIAMRKWESGEAELEHWPTWATNLKSVKVEYLGEAHEALQAGVICASFHAG